MTTYFFPVFYPVALLTAALTVTSCSPGMEARRPTPVDIGQFKPGQTRLAIVSTLGAPEGQISTADGNCDLYSLYTTGLGGLGKGLVTAGEVLTDVATLGLAEIVWTPVQAGTQPAKHTVTVCYTKEDTSISIADKPREG
jgi:hypothetical protein